MTDGFPPIEEKSAVILILGSGPSRKSLEKGMYYAHPSNGFWPIMEKLFSEKAESDEDKRQLLLSHRVALWDTLKRFDRIGSLDSGYRQVEPNDLETFIRGHGQLKAVFFTGKKAEEFYRRFVRYYPEGMVFQALPSPSSANTTPFLAKYQAYKEAFLPFLTI